MGRAGQEQQEPDDGARTGQAGERDAPGVVAFRDWLRATLAEGLEGQRGAPAAQAAPASEHAAVTRR